MYNNYYQKYNNYYCTYECYMYIVHITFICTIIIITLCIVYQNFVKDITPHDRQQRCLQINDYHFIISENVESSVTFITLTDVLKHFLEASDETKVCFKKGYESVLNNSM